MMKRLANTLVMGSLLTGMLFGSAMAADNQPSAKATAKVGNISIIDATDMGWTTILSNTIKTANAKDLFVDASLECGLYTDTLVKSKGGNKDTSTAEASVKVRVMVDGVAMEPGVVNFCRRSQTLSATFQGLLTDANGDSCLITEAIVDVNGTVVGYTTYIDEECLRPEEVQLILDSMNANSFNFILDDLGAGIHTINVQAMIDTGTSAQEGSAEAKATIGKGSVTVESVKMIKNEDISL